MLGHKISHSNFKKIEITSSIFSNHNNMKLVINYKGEKKKPAKKISTSTVAQKIPWMEEPGRLQSMGSLGVGHD